jgi:ribosomal protein S18 acetylase RimI-like enzyme
VIAWTNAGMLAGRDDAVLPDIRGWPGQQGSGTGSALFRAAADRTGARGCRWFKIETQNVNAAACRFYYKMTTAAAPERKHHRAGAADRRHIAMTAIAEFRVVSSLASSASVYRAGRRARMFMHYPLR